MLMVLAATLACMKAFIVGRQKRCPRLDRRRLSLLIVFAGSLLAGERHVFAQDPLIAPGFDAVATNTYPNQQYYLALELYREGDLANAMQAFDGALSRTRRDPNGRWIDAIPVHAMIAECLYQAGDLPGAVDNIDAALALAIRHRGWLGALTWNDLASGAVRPPDPAAAWAAPQVPNLVPMSSRLSIASGDVDLSNTLQRGGVLESAKLTRIDGVEVLRGLATALYRRRIIFGAISGEYEIASQTLEATRYPKGLSAPLPRALIGAMRGCGRFAADQRDELMSDLGQSAGFGGGVHPLSPILLLAGARDAALQDNYAAAVPLALRAAAAASALGQPEWVGEAFAVAAGCVDPTTAPAIQQAATAAATAHQRRGRLAAGGALAAACDAALTAGDTASATTLLAQLRASLNRRDFTQPRLAAYGEYLSAMTAACGGASLGDESAAIDQSLTRLLTFTSGNTPALRRAGARRGAVVPSSPRLYQLALVSANVRGRGVGGRAVEERMAQYVGPPPASVWRSDPVDAIAYCAFDHSANIIGQIASAVTRSSPVDVLVHCDALLRARFVAALPLGGRVQQIRRLASGDRTQLDAVALEVLAKPPAKLRAMTEILAAPAPPAGSPESLARGRNLESLATQLALSRGVVPVTSPRPLTDSKDFERLPAGHGLLSFVDVGGSLIGALVSGREIQVWSVPAPRQLATDVGKVLRGIGANVGRGNTSRLDDDANWKTDAARLRQKLIPDERLADLSKLQHLTIVPDSVLWYLPMELLPLGETDAVLLGEQLSVRYAPTLGLAVHPAGAANPQLPTGTVSQLFFAPRDGNLNGQLVTQLIESLDQHLALPGNPPLASSQLGQTIGCLAVLAAVTPNPAAPLATAVSLYDSRPTSGTLAAWLRFPAQPPTMLYLPGFRTAAGAAQLGDGRELFMTLTALHAAGVRDIVISRWPVGGESTALLSREFLQELPFEGIEPAWRRAVQTLRQAPLNPETEPLLGAKDQKRESLSGEHPLFWVGYLLVSPPQQPMPAAPQQPAPVQPPGDGQAADGEAENPPAEEPEPGDPPQPEEAPADAEDIDGEPAAGGDAEQSE